MAKLPCRILNMDELVQILGMDFYQDIPKNELEDENEFYSLEEIGGDEYEVE